MLLLFVTIKCTQCEIQKEEHAALATKERSVGLPLAKRLQFLKNVRGHITVAPRTWMKDDLILIRGSQNVSVVREKAANGLEMEISGNMVTSTAFDVQVTMLDVVQ